MTKASIVILAALVSLLTPIVFIAIRESVKRQRQEMVRDLEAVFAPPNGGDNTIIPSFEFVKYKYMFDRIQGRPEARTPKDFTRTSWVMGAIPFVLLLFGFSTIVFGIIAHAAFGATPRWKIIWLTGISPVPLFGWVIVSSYVGAYLFTIRAFFQAINNFDFSPASLVGACVNFLFGLSMSLIFVFGLIRISRLVEGGGPDPANPILFTTVLVSAFAVGYFPNVALRNVIRASRLKFYKGEDTTIYDKFAAVPIEIIDGINTEIRDRLSDFHIEAVQNLAAANPLMLFVETPYGVYQILDWVAQAQLCSSVGPAALVRLWQIGIRTIFDLERAALDRTCRNGAILARVGAILLPATDKIIPNPDEAAIVANICLRLNDSHVHRLRQIYMAIGDKLGPDTRRLPPLADCPPVLAGKCPFAKAA